MKNAHTCPLIRYLAFIIGLAALTVEAFAQTGADNQVPVRIWAKAQSSASTGEYLFVADGYSSGSFLGYGSFLVNGTTVDGRGTQTAVYYYGYDGVYYWYYWRYYEQQYAKLSISGILSGQAVGTSPYQNFSLSLGQNGVGRLQPNQGYTLNLQYSYLQSGELNVAVPPQYRVMLNGYESNRCGLSPNVTLMLVPRNDGPPGAAGFASGLAPDRIDWKLPLGTLRNGDDAGSIRLVNPITNSWDSLFTPAGLSCEPSSDEVLVYRVNNRVKQVIANQVAIDVVVPDGATDYYYLKCYNPSQLQNATPPCTFSGEPFATYTVRRSDDAGDPSTALKIIREFRNDPNAGITRTESTKLVLSGSTWTKSDWHAGSTVVQETVATPVNGATQISVRTPGGSPAMTVSRAYGDVGFGSVLTSETVGTSQAKMATFSYYGDVSQPGSLGFVESVRLSGGGWEAYDYCDSTQAMSYQGGRVKYRYRPFGAGGSDAPVRNASFGEVTYYEYGPDPFGSTTRPTLIRTTVNGIEAARTTISYDSTAKDAYITSTKTDYANAGTPLVTTTEYYSEGWSDVFFRGKPRSVRQPDGVTTKYTYEKGSWDGSTFTPNTTSTTGSRISVEKLQNGGTPFEGVSTKQVTIRDSRALIVRTESYGWASGDWRLMTSTNYSYNFAGLLTGRTSSDGASYSATWDGNLKTSETNDPGITTNFTYDDAGRVLTAIRAGATDGASTIPALTTTYAYDALGHVVQQRVGPPSGEALVTSTTYDDAGRVVAETAPGLGTNQHSYNVAARTHTVTRPDGSTIIETQNRNGTPASRTGTGVVNEYYTYGVESDGRCWTRTDLTRLGSLRWSKVWTDWVGRKTLTRRPVFGATTIDYNASVSDETNVYDAAATGNTGRLLETIKTGIAPTFFSYNAMSQLTRAGLDGDRNDTVSTTSTDRITDTSEVFEYFDDAWWQSRTESNYPYAGSNTATQVSKTSKRLTGLNGYLREETRTWDIFGNETRRTVGVSPLASGGVLTAITTSRMNSSGVAVLAQVERSLNGVPVSTTSFEGLTTTMAYDSLGRRSSVTDPRTGATTTVYKANSTLVQETTDPAGKRLSYAEYDLLGRPIFTKDALNYTTRTAYTLRGEVSRTWGTATYPVSYDYNDYGERVQMSTYQDATDASTTDTSTFPAVGNGNLTAWEYDAPSGLLKKKFDAKAKFVEYDYDSAGRLLHRYWARTLPNSSTRVTTTYSYDANTGEQTSITYNDGTPGLAYVYDRAGHNTSVVQSYTGSPIQTLLDYCLCGKISTEYLDGSFFGGRNLSHLTNNATDGFKGRSTGYALTAGSAVEQSTTYGYQSNTGRFSTLSTTMTGVAAASHTFNYTYLTNSNLLSSLSVDAGHPFTITRGFEPNRDVMTSIETKWSGASRVKYAYTYDDRRQRANVVQSGDVFSDYGGPSNGAIHINFAYNGRGELIQAATWLGTVADSEPDTSFMSARKHEFSYDGIGNRRWANTGGVTGTRDNYSVNELNQYVGRENNTLAVGGTVANDSAIKVAAGANAVAPAGRHGRHWADNMLLDNLNGPYLGPVKFFAAKVGGGTSGADLLKTTQATAFLPPAWETFSYDADGNVLTDGVWNYTWDAENRLVAMETKSAVIGAGIASADARRIEFKYDYLGRRIEKLVRSGWSGSAYATIALQRRFVYDGWNLIAEYSMSGSALTLTRTYTWGLDIAKSLTDAGGVGALLQIHDYAGAGKDYLPSYDGNGNVAALFDADASQNGACVAAYEYSPYGEFLRCEGVYAKENPFRFSTKFTDDESGLVYYGRRYYSPSQGRFLGRDPMQEKGGLNLYGFVHNNPINLWDVLGMWDLVGMQAELEQCNDELKRIYDEKGYDGWDQTTALKVQELNEKIARLEAQLSSATAQDQRMLDELGMGPGTTSVAANQRFLGRILSHIPVVGSIFAGMDAALRDDTSAATMHGILVGLEVTAPGDAIKAGRVFVAGVVVTLRTGAAAVARVYASRELRRQMIAAGIKEVDGYAAHHIVPFGAAGTQQARDALIKYGIDINDAANGVFISPSVNAGLHNNPAYIQAVNSALKAATSRDEALAALRSIQQDILDGVFPGIPKP